MKLFAFILTFILLSASYSVIGQESASTDSLKSYEGNIVPVYSKTYMSQYNRLKAIFIEVYPYALYAADVLDELENDAESIEKRRKKNKFYKQAYKGLKEDFKYVFLDMYQSEGRWLMKLVHRETGMTVYEIASKYRGKKNAGVFSLMGKLWSQDLKAEFDPEGVDKIAEHVIQDIENGIIEFDGTVEITTKEDYKVGMEKYRKNKKDFKKRQRINKRKNKKKNKEKDSSKK